MSILLQQDAGYRMQDDIMPSWRHGVLAPILESSPILHVGLQDWAIVDH